MDEPPQKGQSMSCEEKAQPKTYLSKYGAVGKDFQKSRELAPIPSLDNGHFNFWLPIRFLITLRYTAKDLQFKPALNSYTNYLAAGAQNRHLQNGVIRAASIPQDMQHDFLFIRNQGGSDIIQHNEYYFSRMLEPYMKIASSVGSTVRVEMVRSSAPVKQYIEKTIYILHNKYRGECFYKSLADYRQLFGQICSAFPNAELSTEQICFFIDEIYNLYIFFKEILLRIRPKVVFTVTFYYFYPLHLACRELGIRSVDIQHCYMRGENIVYNFYDKAEVIDSSILPTDFITWSNEDSLHVKSLFPSAKTHNFGYQWPNYCLDIYKNEASEIKNSIKKIITSPDYEKYILVVISDVDIHPLLAAIVQDSRAKERKIKFILRAKPNYSAIATKSEKAKAMATDDYLNHAPLPVLLECVDALLTLQSSAVFEADAMNIPSFVCSHEALSFKDLIEKQQLYHATTVDDFYALFDKVMSEGHRRSSFTTNACDGAASFKAWLKNFTTAQT